MHNIDWCEGGLKLVDIATNNDGDNELSHGIIYIMVRLENLWRNFYKRGDRMQDIL